MIYKYAFLERCIYNIDVSALAYYPWKLELSRFQRRIISQNALIKNKLVLLQVWQRYNTLLDFQKKYKKCLLLNLIAFVWFITIFYFYGEVQRWYLFLLQENIIINNKKRHVSFLFFGGKIFNCVEEWYYGSHLFSRTFKIWSDTLFHARTDNIYISI